MSGLPNLRIGCGKLLPIHSGEEDEQVPCGKVGKLFPKRTWLCDLCQHNFDAVKKHAAAYQKELRDVKKIINKRNKRNDIDTTVGTIGFVHDAEKFRGARDAVLNLAGLTEEDLKEDGN